MIVSILLERSGEQRQIGLVRKRRGGELKNRETYRNGKKRNGLGEAGRTEKYQNRKKKKGSRRGAENRDKSDW
jgi:hypothetical protein